MINIETEKSNKELFAELKELMSKENIRWLSILVGDIPTSTCHANPDLTSIKEIEKADKPLPLLEID